MRGPTRALVVGALLSSIVAVGAAPAGAAPPIQERSTASFEFLLPGGAFCSFGVWIEVELKTKFMLFAKVTGGGLGALSTGKLRATLTNVDTGESIRIQIPGPTFVYPETAEIRGTGPWLVFDDGELYLTQGVILLHSDGTIEQRAGRRLDLCPVLA